MILFRAKLQVFKGLMGKHYLLDNYLALLREALFIVSTKNQTKQSTRTCTMKKADCHNVFYNRQAECIYVNSAT